MLKIKFKFILFCLLASFLFLLPTQAQDNSINEKIDKGKLAEDWKAIKNKYPNFALMYMHDVGMQFDLITSISAVRLEDKYEKYFPEWGKRICLLGFLPKCPPAPCKDCSSVIEGELDVTELEDYAQCEIERRECESKVKLCCN
jgi:hypothetical protein